jgi:voltage-gated potassium channel
MKKTATKYVPDFGKLEFFMLGLIIANLIAFSLETILPAESQWSKFLGHFEIASVCIFTIEYFARVVLSRPFGCYALSFLGVVDLVAILPFYLTGFLDLRAIRILRLLRLFRILKLARYTNALERLIKAFKSIREELVISLSAAGVVLYLASIGIYYFERDAQPETFGSVFNCMWWATATLTTVGYGDVYPVTVGGKIFTFFILLIGLGIVAIPTALFAGAMISARTCEDDKKANTE